MAYYCYTHIINFSWKPIEISAKSMQGQTATSMCGHAILEASDDLIQWEVWHPIFVILGGEPWGKVGGKPLIIVQQFPILNRYWMI